MSWHSSENVFCGRSSWKIRKHVKRYKGLLRDVTDIYHFVGEQGGKLNWYLISFKTDEFFMNSFSIENRFERNADEIKRKCDDEKGWGAEH